MAHRIYDGPWKDTVEHAPDMRNATHTIRDAAGWEVCVLHGVGPAAEKAARQIAALPELLAAAEEMVAECAPGGCRDEQPETLAIQMLRAALGKE